jgi:hypothetical protein
MYPDVATQQKKVCHGAVAKLDSWADTAGPGYASLACPLGSFKLKGIAVSMCVCVCVSVHVRVCACMPNVRSLQEMDAFESFIRIISSARLLQVNG